MSNLLNNMPGPGFTAKASLYRTSGRYHLSGGMRRPLSVDVVQPAGLILYGVCVAICCLWSFLGICPECFAACLPALAEPGP